ncbi:RnfABCDGE type electron transport complex subunit D [Oxalobacter sp. OttesenSCG-928-P03]|nr:RnfABCDGE type electron transport complex subunit D [Oxalobacter sp. OttesenSCG-928-P03]
MHLKVRTRSSFPPFVRKKDSTPRVMADVVVALIPCVFMSWLAYGFTPVMVVLVALGSALAAEFLFSLAYFGRTDPVSDGSAVITGILLAFTIAPFTPLYVVAFGGAMAVIFGKLLWGGLGRNMFNPALVGREFMTICFPAVMASRSIWYNAGEGNISSVNISGMPFINDLFYKPAGAIGEYSVFFLVLGGLYLLFRRRISWHIPFALCTAFTACFLLFSTPGIRFSLGGVLLGAIYMATDMPTSSSTRYGKLYYGAMIGVAAVICLLNGVRYEYMSYAILLLNAFARPVNWVFRPRVWGTDTDMPQRLLQGTALTAAIFAVCFAVIYLHRLGAVMYLVFAYIAFCVLRFIVERQRARRAAAAAA